MGEDEIDPHTLWNARAYTLAYQFAAECERLRDSRPVADADELAEAIDALATELWDRDFSLSQIRGAFEAAMAALPRYANGFESRSVEAKALAGRAGVGGPEGN